MPVAEIAIMLVEITKLANMLAVMQQAGEEPTEAQKEQVRAGIRRANDLWENAGDTP